MTKKVVACFLLIILLASFLRVYKINEIPPALNWDEVSIGYNAYSVLKTGRDEWGQFLPLSFRAFGDYKLPLYIYLDVPFIALFGLTEAGVRLPSVLAGIGTVVLIFFILHYLTRNWLLALIGMFFAAVLPWSIILSRISLEANLALFLTTLSLYLFLLSSETKYTLVLSSLFLGLSVFTYNSSRVLIGPFLILIVIFFQDRVRFFKREVVAAALLLSFFVIVAVPLGIFRDSGSRFRWTTILDEGAVNQINQMRGNSILPSWLTSLFYNKATYFLSAASKNYLSHFHPDFLFFKGGSNYQFSVPGSGLISPLILPLVIMGVIQILKQRKRDRLFVLAWLLIAPVPAAITRDSPHSLRAIFMITPLIIVATLGVEFIRQFLKRKIFNIFIALLVLLVTVSTHFFWNNYTSDYIQKYSWSWQYGYKQAVNFIQDNIHQYDRVVFTKKYGEPHEFLLFYLSYDPWKYQNSSNLVRFKQSDWFWVNSFDKFEFINDWEVADRTYKKNSLLVTSPGNYPPGSSLVKTINFMDDKPAFDIVAIE